MTLEVFCPESNHSKLEGVLAAGYARVGPKTPVPVGVKTAVAVGSGLNERVVAMRVYVKEALSTIERNYG